MGFFFRKSACFGPLRFNFSKSGIGASIGVRGARITATPRGTTYITVGSHGFYYRETLSSRKGAGVHTNVLPNVQPTTIPLTPSSDEIPTAHASELVDSSSETLLNRLNERARASNPAWILYFLAAAGSIAGAVLLVAASTVPYLPSPDLPDVSSPLGVDRRNNTADEYALIVSRYGEPDSILSSEPHAAVPKRTATYSSAHASIVFVANGCVDAHERGLPTVADQSRARSSTKRIVPPCEGTPGWTIVGYIDTIDSSSIPAQRAKLLLDGISVKRTSAPLEQVETSPTAKQTRNQRATKTTQSTGMKVDRPTQSEHGAQVTQAKGTVDLREMYSGGAVLIGSLGLLIIAIVVHKKNTANRVTRLFYELNEAEQQKYALVQQALSHLSQAQRVWRIEGESRTADWKRHAGASSLVRRAPVSVSNSNPPRVLANLSVPCMDTGFAKLFFLPDLILYLGQGTYGAIAYNDFAVEQQVIRFIEDEQVPGDAIVVDRTWRYVNKSGGPDRRFNNNVQLPVVQYGVLVLTSSRGLNIHLDTSNVQASLAFATCWRDLHGRAGRTQQRESSGRKNLDIPSDRKSHAFKLLGVNATASSEEISAAYHRLAQMYHPDKVAGLALEFGVLAEQRMKEINAAYALLKN